MTRAQPTVHLRPITADEFPAFMAASKAGYADGIEAHGGQSRTSGLGRLELNVFGGNVVALGLYRSLGYVETSTQMAKELD